MGSWNQGLKNGWTDGQGGGGRSHAGLMGGQVGELWREGSTEWIGWMFVGNLIAVRLLCWRAVCVGV